MGIQIRQRAVGYDLVYQGKVIYHASDWKEAIEIRRMDNKILNE